MKEELLFIFFALTIPLYSVNLTFKVRAPEETTVNDTVYVMGNLPEMGAWDPDSVPLQKSSTRDWEIDFSLSQGTDVYYNYTKGSFFYIEKGEVGEAIGVRMLTVPNTDTVIFDTVQKWGQFGPYLSWENFPDSTMIVSWRTEDSGSYRIEYGLDTSLSNFKVDSISTKLHSMELGNLIPDTTYHYRVSSSTGEMSDKNTFSTAISRYKPFCFVGYGDTRTNDDDRAKVISRIININPDLIFNTGDLVGDGAVDEYWETWFSTNQDILDHIPYFVAIGNHEQNAQLYFDYWHFPGNEQWYSVDYGNAHFICLSTETGLWGDQRTWLAADLDSASQHADWIFVFFHRPPYSSGSHGSNLEVRNAWCSLFETYGVDMVFNGHDHNYERSFVNGVYYVVTGGGGAPLRPCSTSSWTIYSEMTLHCCKINVDSLKIHFKAIKPDGTVFDSFTIDKTSGISINNHENRTEEIFQIGNIPSSTFLKKVTLPIEVRKKCNLKIDIFNLSGQRVKTVYSGTISTGKHRFTWDGKNEKGREVASGIYFFKLLVKDRRHQKYSEIEKIILIKDDGL